MVLKKDGWPLRAGPKFRVWTDKPDDTYLIIVSMIYMLQKVAGGTHCDVADARFVDVAGVAHVAYANVGTWGKLSFSLLQDQNHPCRHFLISANPRQYENLQLKLRVHISQADHVSR